MKYCLFVTILLTTAFDSRSQSDIRKIDFKNFSYSAHCLSQEPENITVTDGEFYEEKQEEGYVDRFYFKVFDIAYGDLNQDAKDEAVILSVCNTGGTGNFSEGFVYAVRAGKPVLIGRIPGGDRAYGGLRSAKIEDAVLIVDSNDVGEEGGACCPQFVVTTRYRLTGNKLAPFGTPARRELYPKQRITFAKGTSGTSIKVRIPAQELKRFVVGARAGQRLTVSIDKNDASVGLANESEADMTIGYNSFSAPLPKNGDYVFEVQNNAETELMVTVNVRIN